MVILAREKPQLSRDVIFMATADEEVAFGGARWLIDNKAKLFKDAEYLITEGGDNLLKDNKVVTAAVGVAEKAPYWLKLTAKGQPGHGSRPIVDSAPNRLIRAMSKIIEAQTPIKLLPAVEKYIKDIAPLQSEPLRSEFANITTSLKDPAFVKKITANREFNYLFRNTISLTMLSGSAQTNVIPNQASCNLDVRLLPGEKPEDFLAYLKGVIADPTIEFQQTKTFFPAISSPTDTELFRIIEKVTKQYHPEAITTTKLLSGATESVLFRPLGIASYGWAPINTTPEEGSGVHGNNERVTVSNIRQGIREMYEVISQIAR
jgi:acetylornithine deacetylase/succinyl-diaminopimelate desuccinylase-like protein